MPHYLATVAASPWVLAVVFTVAGLDAIVPFMPSESTVVACGVASAAGVGPEIGWLVGVAALGAYVGDQISFRIGRRGTKRVAARLRHHRVRALHAWVRRLLHHRGGLVIIFARYLPGGRSTTALAAGLVGYPPTRFHWYTAAGVVLWAGQAALLGYLGGSTFASRPMLGLVIGCACALAAPAFAVLRHRRTARSAPPATHQDGGETHARNAC